jgi:beta-phosphoglucomutase-like phosphatase (HAD superfamily)
MQSLEAYERSTLPDSGAFDWDHYKWRTDADYGVILNFNGVLLASQGIDRQAWKWLFRQLEFDLDDGALADLIECGLPPSLSMLTLGGMLQIDRSRVEQFAITMAARREQYKVAVFLTKGKQMGGARELLRTLCGRRVPLGLYSMFSQRSVLEILRARKLKQFFSAVVTPDMPLRHRGGIALEDCLSGLVERLGLRTEKCFLVEDSAPRVRTATGLGLACIGVGARNKKRLRSEGAIYVVDDLRPLARIFGKRDTKQSVVAALEEAAVGRGRGRQPNAERRRAKG